MGKYAYGFSIRYNKLLQMLPAYSNTKLVYSPVAQKPGWVQLDSLLKISQGQNQGVTWAGL